MDEGGRVPGLLAAVSDARLARVEARPGPNPIELVTYATGDWALRFLLITLALTPLSKVFSMPRFTLFRRMLGLFAFFYGCLHFFDLCLARQVF